MHHHLQKFWREPWLWPQFCQHSHVCLWYMCTCTRKLWATCTYSTKINFHAYCTCHIAYQVPCVHVLVRLFVFNIPVLIQCIWYEDLVYCCFSRTHRRSYCKGAFITWWWVGGRMRYVCTVGQGYLHFHQEPDLADDVMWCKIYMLTTRVV